jgi:hypothetical protein
VGRGLRNPATRAKARLILDRLGQTKVVP